MKVAYFAESPADQAAATILTEAVLGKTTETVLHAGLRHRGWPAVRTALRAVLLQLHYHTDAEGIVLIVDSNGTPPHAPNHDVPSGPEGECRWCQLRGIADRALQQAGPRSHLAPLKVAIGLAVPAIEAWLLGSPRVNEALWINGRQTGQMPYTKEDLKNRLYGTSRPSLAHETKVMKSAAKELSQNLQAVERLFPGGFGALVNGLRGW